MKFSRVLKIVEIPVLIFLLCFLFWFGLKPGWNQTKTDFPNYYVSAQMMLNGKLTDAYNIEKFNQQIRLYNPEASGLFVMYPPPTALLMLPLTFLK